MTKKSLFLISSFLAGFSLMTVELISTRILAPYVGASIYTWTSVIGVILLGLSVGNYLGGYLIDKYRSLKTLFSFFILSSLFTAAIPILTTQAQFFVFLDLLLPIVIILISIILFFLPAVFIGTLYPSILKFYSEDVGTIGLKSGQLSSLWSIGSIVGTFLTGFYFIGHIGNNTTIFFISAVLFINGLFFYRPKIKNLIILIVISATIIYSPQLINKQNNVIFNHESNYYTIRVVDGVHNIFGNIRVLFLDFDAHSAEGLDGQQLNTYPEIYPVFSVLKSNIHNILTIGGGSYLIAKNFSDFYKNSKITVVEIDPAVTKTAEEFFNLKSYPIQTVISDGRIFLQKNNQKYDLIFSDAYNSFVSIPWHLATKEFNDLAKSHLTDGGIYAVNFTSAFYGKNSAFFRSMLSTFKKTFENYQIFSFGEVFPTDPQNIILVGVNSNEQIDPLELREKIMALKNGELLSSKLVIKKPLDDNALVLTDNFAPIEKLMTPLINNYFSRYAEFYYSFLKNQKI
ncbi:MAG: fused MFS/spermidine synthase [Patescibacteria group bacterium]|mgnify:CR=1 FL=1